VRVRIIGFVRPGIPIYRWLRYLDWRPDPARVGLGFSSCPGLAV